MTLSSADRHHVRGWAVASVLEKTDRILGHGELDVKVVATATPAPGWTDGKIISINATRAPMKEALKEGFTPRRMLLLTGINYHELAHCMFMPRTSTPLVKRIFDQGYAMSFNILQDQTDETRFVKLYEPARHYFTAVVSDLMMARKLMSQNYVLVSGRLFLPQRIRDTFRDAFKHPQILDDIDRLVDEYKSLCYPGDQDRMFEIVEEFDKLIYGPTIQISVPVLSPHNVNRGKPQGELLQELDDQPEYETREEQENDEQGDLRAPSDPAGDRSDDGAEEGSAAPRHARDEGDDPDEGNQGGASTPEKDEEPPLTAKQTREKIRKMLEEEIEATISEIEPELNERIASLRSEEHNYRVDARKERYSYFAPTSEHQLIVRKCKDEFRRVQMQHRPGWHSRQKVGKLNPRHLVRALRGEEDVYRKWKEGVHDALDFEIVFLLDQSSSMNRRMKEASIALWILKRVFEEMDGVVTVLGYADFTRLLSQRGEKAKQSRIPHYGSGGNTYVAKALREALRVLSVSRKPLKLCVVITDGGFTDRGDADNLASQFPHPLALVGIEFNQSGWSGIKNVLHTQKITKPMELVDVTRNLALRLSEERLSRRRYS